MSSKNEYERRKRNRISKRAATLELLEQNAIALAQLSEQNHESSGSDAEVFNLQQYDHSDTSGISGDERSELHQESTAEAIDLCHENALHLPHPSEDNKVDEQDHFKSVNLDSKRDHRSAEKDNDGRLDCNHENLCQTDTLMNNQSFGYSLCRNEASDGISSSSGDENLPEELCASKEISAISEEESDNLQLIKVNSSDVSPEVWQLICGEKKEENAEERLKTKLISWAGHHKVKRNAMDELLHLLREHGHSDLPACSKTLLKTPRCTADLIKVVAGGQFWYRGILNGIKARLTNAYVESLEGNTVTIDIFVDGISPHKSVRRHLWPIAGCLEGEQTPFTIALWCGSSKEPTSVDEFFEDYVEEATYLLENGFVFQEQTFTFKIRRYHADAPARAWIKKVRPHNSYDACERCTVPGEWKFRRITYDPNIEGTLRTDENFEQQIHQEHHVGISPLLRLGTKMVTQVPLDAMHLVYLGCSKRLFTLLLVKKAGKFKLSNTEISELDSLCRMLSRFCPSDFARKIRPLSHFKLFKATEYRRLLLYDGFILQKNHRFKEVYKCYLLLACAMRILLDANLRSTFSSDAHELLVNFVKQSYKVLGSSFVVYNIHHLLHFVSDCLIHGDPDEFSCFKFENHLGHLKDFLAAPGRTLQQIICRLIEQSLLPPASAVSCEEDLYKPHIGPTLDCSGKQYAAMKFAKSVIRVVGKSTPKNSFVLMSSGQVVVVENIIREYDGRVFIIGREFLDRSDYFKYPVSSSVLNIFKVSQLGELCKWKKEDISRKVVYFPINVEESVYDTFNWRDVEGLCMPLLHSDV